VNNRCDENALVQLGIESSEIKMKIMDRLLRLFSRRHRVAVDAANADDDLGSQIRSIRARLFLKLTGKRLVEPRPEDLTKKTDLSDMTDKLSPSRIARKDSQ
jgi:hypothetical protein